MFRCLRRIERSGWAISPGDRAPVATWYSSGWKRWKLRRSTSVTLTSGSMPRLAGRVEPAESAADMTPVKRCRAAGRCDVVDLASGGHPEVQPIAIAGADALSEM